MGITANPTTVRKMAFIGAETLRLWNQRAETLGRCRGGGRASRSKALAQMIDNFCAARKPIEHSWSYEKEGGAPRKIMFDISRSRFAVLERIQKALSDFENGDVGLGFAVSALIWHTEQTAKAKESKKPKARRSQAA